MSLDAFRTALEQLTETSCCEGTAPLTERLAIALPDGDVGALGDKMFVDWLVEHGEPAPFGVGGKTRTDKKVRDAMRLTARGAASVTGFEPGQILDTIEAALSPGAHLDATLTDVLVYRKGGHFARHKDTPRDPALVGTLVVCLPIAHDGGAFHITDGGTPHVVDWSAKKPDRDSVRWVAMFSDVDHEIKPVTSGARVTLVYSLARSNRPRRVAAAAAQLTTLGRIAGAMPVPRRGPVMMVACSRHVITDDETQPLGIDVLRGTDRAIADALIERGFEVAVRSCVTAAFAYNRDHTTPLRREDVMSISRLSKGLTPAVIASLDNLVTFIELDDGDDDYMTLAPYILDAVPLDRWVIRPSAAATLIYEADDFSDDGNFGNEGYAAHIYTLAALEVTRRKVAPKTKTKTKAKPTHRAPAAKKTPAKRR